MNLRDSAATYFAFLIMLTLGINNSPLAAESKNTSSTISLTIAAGCVFGGETGPNFGTIDFGQHSSLTSSYIFSVSKAEAGTILLKCTPGLSYQIALDAGQNSSESGGNQMHNASHQQYVPYELFQNSQYSVPWTLASQLSSVGDGSTRAHTVFARIAPQSLTPPAGTYTDSVTVIVSF